MSPENLEKRRIQQLPVDWRKNHDAIINSTILTDIPEALNKWGCKRIVLVYSRGLDKGSEVVKDLRKKLGSLIVAEKAGVGSHSPYDDVIDIAHMLSHNDADCLISVGSSSYSDACKIARLMHSTLPADFGAEDMEKLVDQEKGVASGLKAPTVKLILVPTSLSASEWNQTSSATNAEKKKQHFGIQQGAADLILLDPEVASTSPRKLWLSSGVRAVDHCVETICNPEAHEEVNKHMEEALKTLLKGLKEYKEGEDNQSRAELLEGVSECQVGARQAMMGLLLWKIPMGASHAIGHQLGSVGGVMHGVTSCIMLSPVLRYMKDKQARSQEIVLKVFNETLGWKETEAADAVAKFVKFLGLPNRLSEVDIKDESQFQEIAEKTMTDVFGKSGLRLDSKEKVMEILNMAK
ncbi:maleylacetate reductase [Delitschia confertaspora ATCC 74209]|uniref:Maleylacetate reductase n=1 Tax=Delitschia confertaspora ATCC 74209 TaxID=1513339 RepID=A0A9P4JS27_9PLEO|nr:maleylacetate reductase [Delitschia confertaspora ATCC 74209]